MDAIPLFFLLGFAARLARSDLKLPGQLYEALSIYLLLAGGLLIGWAAGPQGLAPLEPFFFELFKGVLCLFLLEMGLVAAGQAGALRTSGAFLAGFAIGMPVIAAFIGTATGLLIGLSAGGTLLLATLAASASYIAAPAAMRIAVPEANPGLSITAALVITFPFNILIGIPLYDRIVGLFFGS